MADELLSAPQGRQALPPVFIDQVQNPHRPAIIGKSVHKTVRPDVITPFRSQVRIGAVVESQPPARLLSPRYLQPFAASDSLHAVLTDSPQTSTPEAKISIRMHRGLKYDISDPSQGIIVSADPFHRDRKARVSLSSGQGSFSVLGSGSD